jgi:SNF2 family DNA or RNA helicase
MDRLKDYAPALYTGTESSNQKDEARRRFIEGKAPVLIMSLRSGAGLDGLQHHARTVVFGELDWSPGVHDQCAGPLHRDGQSEPVVADYLLADEGVRPPSWLTSSA